MKLTPLQGFIVRYGLIPFALSKLLHVCFQLEYLDILVVWYYWNMIAVPLLRLTRRCTSGQTCKESLAIIHDFASEGGPYRFCLQRGAQSRDPIDKAYSTVRVLEARASNLTSPEDCHFEEGAIRNCLRLVHSETGRSVTLRPDPYLSAEDVFQNALAELRQRVDKMNRAKNRHA